MVSANCPGWVSTLSNKVLLPVFFLTLTAVFLYTSTQYEGFLNIDLSLAGVFSGLMAMATSLS